MASTLLAPLAVQRINWKRLAVCLGAGVLLSGPLSVVITNRAFAQNTPSSVLDIYINDMTFPGWEPQPFYMWSPPAEGIVIQTPIYQPAPAAEGGAQAVHTPQPRLPENDPTKQAILAEYKLSGFFRKSFKRGQRIIYVDIYDFQSADGAYGAYNYLRRGATTVMPRGDAASEDDESISVVQGKTFLSIYGTSQDDDESKEVLTKIANQALKYVGDKGLQPQILNRLPRLELVHGSEKIVMGAQSMRRFFPAPFLTSLVSDNTQVVGAVGDYQVQEPAKERLKLMILSYKNAGEASGAYQNFLTQMAEARSGDLSTMLAQPIYVAKSGATYVGIALRRADILMVVGAKKRFSPAILLREVR